MSTKIYASQDWVEERLTSSQSDWNQNDETKPDYVKNRTHYEYEDWTVVEDGYIDNIFVPNEVGKEMTVKVNGVEQSFVIQVDEFDGEEAWYIGTISPTEFDNGAEGWWLWVWSNDNNMGGFEVYTNGESENYEFAVRKTLVKTIPEKYFPFDTNFIISGFLNDFLGDGYSIRPNPDNPSSSLLDGKDGTKFTAYKAEIKSLEDIDKTKLFVEWNGCNYGTQFVYFAESGNAYTHYLVYKVLCIRPTSVESQFAVIYDSDEGWNNFCSVYGITG